PLLRTLSLSDWWQAWRGPVATSPAFPTWPPKRQEKAWNCSVICCPRQVALRLWLTQPTPSRLLFWSRSNSRGRLPGFVSSLSRWPEDLKKQKPHSPQYPRRGRRLSLFREFSFPKLLLSSP